MFFLFNDKDNFYTRKMDQELPLLKINTAIEKKEKLQLHVT